eukprot:s4904_g1.t1
MAWPAKGGKSSAPAAFAGKKGAGPFKGATTNGKGPATFRASESAGKDGGLFRSSFKGAGGGDAKGGVRREAPASPAPKGLLGSKGSVFTRPDGRLQGCGGPAAGPGGTIRAGGKKGGDFVPSKGPLLRDGFRQEPSLREAQAGGYSAAFGAAQRQPVGLKGQGQIADRFDAKGFGGKKGPPSSGFKGAPPAGIQQPPPPVNKGGEKGKRPRLSPADRIQSGEPLHTGIVRSFNPDKKNGFIDCQSMQQYGSSVYVFQDVLERALPIKAGQKNLRLGFVGPSSREESMQASRAPTRSNSAGRLRSKLHGTIKRQLSDQHSPYAAKARHPRRTKSKEEGLRQVKLKSCDSRSRSKGSQPQAWPDESPISDSSRPVLLAGPPSPKARSALKELSQLHRPPKCWPLSPRRQGSLGSQAALCVAKDLKRSFHKKASLPYAALFLADLRGGDFPLEIRQRADTLSKGEQTLSRSKWLGGLGSPSLTLRSSQDGEDETPAMNHLGSEASQESSGGTDDASSRRKNRLRLSISHKGRTGAWGMNSATIGSTPTASAASSWIRTQAIQDTEPKTSIIMVDTRDERIVSPFQAWLVREIMTNSSSSVNVLTERDQVMPPNSGYHLSLFANYTLDGVKATVAIAIDSQTGSPLEGLGVLVRATALALALSCATDRSSDDAVGNDADRVEFRYRDTNNRIDLKCARTSVPATWLTVSHISGPTLIQTISRCRVEGPEQTEQFAQLAAAHKGWWHDAATLDPAKVGVLVTVVAGLDAGNFHVQAESKLFVREPEIVATRALAEMSHDGA